MTHDQDTYPNRQSHHKPSGWAIINLIMAWAAMGLLYFLVY